jgi:hypothetical protein
MRIPTLGEVFINKLAACDQLSAMTGGIYSDLGLGHIAHASASGQSERLEVEPRTDSQRAVVRAWAKQRMEGTEPRMELRWPEQGFP